MEPPLPRVTAAIRSQLAPTGVLRVALNMRNELLTRTDPSTGEPAGVAPELGRELAGRLGMPVAMCPYPNPGDAADAGSRGEWDVCFLAVEPERAREIDFTAPYVEIEATYLVPAGSGLRRADEVDAEGVRIIAPARAAFELYLTRTLERAALARASGVDDALARFLAEGFDALAGLRPRLVRDQTNAPGSRIVQGRFTAVRQAAGVPRGRPAAAAAYVRTFIEDVRASGLVAELIERNGVVGLTIATGS